MGSILSTNFRPTDSSLIQDILGVGLNGAILSPEATMRTQHPTLKTGIARFVNSRLSDAFIPWSVGERICPGRGFARCEIHTIAAITVERFDMEILTLDGNIEVKVPFTELALNDH